MRWRGNSREVAVLKYMQSFLDTDCTEDHQVAYNVIAAHMDRILPPIHAQTIEDYTLEIIERSVKVLDYFNKEKIVRRCTVALLDNLKNLSENCHEIMSDIGCHWNYHQVTEQTLG